MDTVVAEKIFDVNLDSRFANIAAFIIYNDTNRYIRDIFSALTITWAYIPNDTELALYREFYSEFYADDILQLFDAAVQRNQRTLTKMHDIKMKGFKNLYTLIETVKSKRVYI